ncbi:MAG: 50S ribosomal protein L25 [candidate division WOR-3 bacterium]|nr:50S ribosomal protein L25 [candidate division WOR-3 bacterium]
MEYSLKAEERKAIGTSASKKLRRQGLIPGVIYGHRDNPLSIVVAEREFSTLLEKIKGHSPIINLSIGEMTIKTVLKSLQREPISKRLLSVDFQRIHAKEKITLKIPVILKGSAIGVKMGGILDHPLRAIPIKCEIEKVPEHIEIDISDLKLGHSIHIADLKIEGVEFMLPPDTPIVSVLTPRKLVEEAVAVTEEIKEPEVITEKKKEEVETAEAETGGKKKSTAESTKTSTTETKK